MRGMCLRMNGGFEGYKGDEVSGKNLYTQKSLRYVEILSNMLCLVIEIREWSDRTSYINTLTRTHHFPVSNSLGNKT